MRKYVLYWLIYYYATHHSQNKNRIAIDELTAKRVDLSTIAV